MSATSWKVRVFGIRVNSSVVTLCAIVVDRQIDCLAVSPVTFTTSLTAPIVRLRGKSTVRPSRIRTSSACTFWKPCSSTVTV